MLDVPGDEHGHPGPGRAVRLDLEPQLRRTAGFGRPDPPHEPADGGRGGSDGARRRREGAVVDALALGCVETRSKTALDSPMRVSPRVQTRMRQSDAGNGGLVEPVSRVSGRMAPLDRADVDTDQIIPKQFLKRIERTGYGPFLFFDWRAGGAFLVRKPEHLGGLVLVTRRPFAVRLLREPPPPAAPAFCFP